MRPILSVDVEDWFHILDTPAAPGYDEWSEMESRVERNFDRLLELFDEHDTSVTCFFLGWVAEEFPHLVRRAADAGHEIASHGYRHRLVYEMGREDFVEDAARTRELLEEISGESVRGYRAAGFSVTEQTPWFFEGLLEAGYHYDSSIFPASRQHGGLVQEELGPYVAESGTDNELVEFPISVAQVFGKRMCFFGGGYLRLFPLFLVKRMSRRVLDQGRPVVYYVHPREIDPEQPRLSMSAWRRFKSYVNLGTTEPKLHAIIEEFEPTSFRDVLAEGGKEGAGVEPRVA